MKITLCGSIAFYSKMKEIKKKLETLGHEVDLPPSKVPDGEGKMIPVEKYYEIRKATERNDGWVWDLKEKSMRNHFNKVAWADSIVVTNFDKNDIKNYIGANTLLEMGLAFHLKKKIYLLNPIPEISYKEEIFGMKPTVLNSDLSKIYIKKEGPRR